MYSSKETLKAKVKDLKPHPKNPKLHNDELIEKSISELGYAENIVIDETNTILAGHGRVKALKKIGTEEVEVIKITGWTDEEKEKYLLLANQSTILGGFDKMKLQDFDSLILDYSEIELEREEFFVEKLTESFVVPPFTILDTRQGYWQERKKSWKALINDEGESRENKLGEGMLAGINSGVSILDPVLSEITNKWFGFEGCKTFDPFAGDSVFGFVSDYLGNFFTGIEIRQEQVDLNNARLKNSKSVYICDDGQNVAKHIPKESQDLMFSCPPYFDLEHYSELENDASNQEDYESFIKIIDKAFTDSITCLKNNRFAVIVAGDVRDKKGFYYGFVDDIKAIFKRNGMGLYNEMILVETLGTLPQRVRNSMRNRKIGKCHQNVLVFYKGDTKEIQNNYPVLKQYESENMEFAEVDETN